MSKKPTVEEWVAWMNSNLPETKSPFLQGYSDAIDERISLIAYDTDAGYKQGYDQAIQDIQQLEKTDEPTF